MKKPKAPSLKKLYEGIKKDYADYKEKVRAYIMAERSLSNSRPLMTIAPANDKGLINGLTIPELVLLVNLSRSNGEYVVLGTVNDGKNLQIVAKKVVPTPFALF